MKALAAVIPVLQYPLRTDPKPRLIWPEGLTHLPDGQWPLGLPVDKPLAFTVDRYVDERKVRR